MLKARKEGITVAKSMFIGLFIPRYNWKITTCYWKIQCKLPPKTKRFCPLVLK